MLKNHEMWPDCTKISTIRRFFFEKAKIFAKKDSKIKDFLQKSTFLHTFLLTSEKDDTNLGRYQREMKNPQVTPAARGFPIC